MNATELVQGWTEDARALGRQHGPNPTDETNPLDIIDLQALADVTGEGISWGELAEIQASLTTAYEQGVSEAVQ